MTRRIKMKFTLFCVVGLFLVLFGTAQSDNRDIEKHVTEFEKNLWKVAANLYKGADKNTEQENLIFSPLSLTTCMAMLNSGAEGQTATEIQNLFKFGNNLDFTIRNQTAVLNSLKNQRDAQFVTASKIYANKENANLRQNYVRAVSSLGEVETLDFSDPKQVVDEINEWVKNQTQEKIGNIVKDKDFDKETAVVLLNALYFKAPWKQPFNKSNTESEDFHVSDGNPVKVDMMYISEEFPYVDLDEAQASAVFLPYKGDRFNMVIYLPWKERKLSVLEGKLETLIPAEIRNQATTTAISLHLPKFNISSSLDFKEILESLNVTKMFKREEADFRKLSESEGFYVSKVRQNVFILVNEEGTEAAAVTDATGLAPVSAPNVVKVNRPFIFQIYDSVTGTVLLSGRVSNPNNHGSFQPKRMDEPTVDSPWNIFIGIFSTLVVIIIGAGIAFFVRAKGYFNRTLVPTNEAKNNML